MGGELLPHHVTYTGQRLGWKHSPRLKPIHREAVEIEGEKGVLAALLPAQTHTHQPQGRRNRGEEPRRAIWRSALQFALKQPRL